MLRQNSSRFGASLKRENNRVIVALLYRPPRHTAAALEADFDTLEQQFQHVLVNFPDCPIVIAGDLNCDLLSVSSPSRSFLHEYLDKYSLKGSVPPSNEFPWYFSLDRKSLFPPLDTAKVLSELEIIIFSP